MLMEFQVILLIVILINGVGIKDDPIVESQLIMGLVTIAALSVLFATVY